MKWIFAIHCSLLLAQAAVAADNTCEKNFGLDVAYCAQTLNDTQFSSPKEKGEWQKACVDQAKINKMVCEAGGPPPPTCSQQCQINYDAAVLTCNQTYNAQLIVCGASISCQMKAATDQANCLNAALNTLNACLAACPVP